jgi:NAD+ diphosphatase
MIPGTMPPTNLFSGSYLDRRAEARLSPDWLDEARRDSGTRYLLMRGTETLMWMAADGSIATPRLLTGEDPRVANASDPDRLLLLGWFREQRCLLVDLDPDTTPAGPEEHFAELRPLASQLPAEDAGLIAYARALSLWRANHRHCSRCGAPTIGTRAGHVRECANCGLQNFPRIDPAVIVLVHDGERALLGRQASWPTGRYSTIAGFVEPGESLEDAVHREVLEETGIQTREIQYQSSQPWPFPASLMLGFLARGEFAEPRYTDGELEDARWFGRPQIASGEVLLPPPHSISRQLIETWLAAG